MKFILTFLIFLFAISVQSQCKISLDEFSKLSQLSENDLESYALRKGFEFDHTRDGYYCNKQNRTDGRDLIVRSTDAEGNEVTVYTFWDVDVYLEFKTKLENDGRFLFTEDEEGARTKGYQYKDKMIFMISRTVVHNNQRVNFYTAMTSM